MRRFAFVFGVMVLALSMPARAEYPDKPVRIIVPVAAGGGVDVMARLLAQKLSERWSQQFIAENRAGAAGVIGSKVVISSPPDGATLLYTPSSLSLTVVVNKTPPYDVSKDFTPIVNVAISPYALVVHPSVPAKNLQEFMALAKAKPGELFYASSGVGGPNHLAGEIFNRTTGLQITHVPFQGEIGRAHV